MGWRESADPGGRFNCRHHHPPIRRALTRFAGKTLSYDANGNLIGDGTNSYTWDARNHLMAISGTNSASFVYDTLGRRVSRTVNGTVTQYLYDGFNPMQLLNGTFARYAAVQNPGLAVHISSAKMRAGAPVP